MPHYPADAADLDPGHRFGFTRPDWVRIDCRTEHPDGTPYAIRNGQALHRVTAHHTATLPGTPLWRACFQADLGLGHYPEAIVRVQVVVGLFATYAEAWAAGAAFVMPVAEQEKAA